MRRAAVVVVAPLVLVAAGCAVVSGLSSLDIGAGLDGALVDASVDAKGEAAIVDAKSDVADAKLDADASPSVDAGIDANDAGSCPVVGTDPAAVQSVCVTGTPIFAAGTIPAGTYALTQVREFSTTCNGYVPLSVSGVLNIAVQGSTYQLQERLTINGVVSQRNYTATVNNTNMTVTLVCGPAIQSNLWQLNVSAQGGKTQFIALKQGTPYDQRFFWLQQ